MWEKAADIGAGRDVGKEWRRRLEAWLAPRRAALAVTGVRPAVRVRPSRLASAVAGGVLEVAAVRRCDRTCW